MNRITRKSEVNQHLESCFNAYRVSGLQGCLGELHSRILSHKTKFPLLEYCGEVLHENLPEDEHLSFLNQIHGFRTEGGNVVIGIVLQKRLKIDFNGSIQQAVKYIADADAWYVCDIIGERVFGFALLAYPDRMIPEVKQLSGHESNWVIRSLGAGVHYAVKKGLSKEHTDILFEILLSMADTNDKEIRQGVGWAAKTTARFHPDLIDRYENKIEDTERVANWFRRKIETGLQRNRYAKGN